MAFQLVYNALVFLYIYFSSFMHSFCLTVVVFFLISYGLVQFYFVPTVCFTLLQTLR